MGEISRFGQVPPTRVFTPQVQRDDSVNNPGGISPTLADSIRQTSNSQAGKNEDVFIRHQGNT